MSMFAHDTGPAYHESESDFDWSAPLLTLVQAIEDEADGQDVQFELKGRHVVRNFTDVSEITGYLFFLFGDSVARAFLYWYAGTAFTGFTWQLGSVTMSFTGPAGQYLLIQYTDTTGQPVDITVQYTGLS